MIDSAIAENRFNHGVCDFAKEKDEKGEIPIVRVTPENFSTKTEAEESVRHI